MDAAPRRGAVRTRHTVYRLMNVSWSEDTFQTAYIIVSSDLRA